MPRREETVALYDSETQEVRLLPKDDLDKKLEELSRVLKFHLGKLEHLGNYELDEIKVKIALKAGILVFSAVGGIELKYTRNPKPVDD